MKSPAIFATPRIFHSSNGWFIDLRPSDRQFRLNVPHVDDGKTLSAGPFITKNELESWFDFFIATHRNKRFEATEIPDELKIPSFSRSLKLVNKHTISHAKPIVNKLINLKETPKSIDGLVGARILLIDDCISFQRLTVAMLKKVGIKSVKVAPTLAEGLHQLYYNQTEFARPEFDLVLMDVNLPDGNGMQGCEFATRHASSHDIPVIIVTGGAEQKTIDCAFEAGASDFMQKPLVGRHLKDRIEVLLKG